MGILDFFKRNKKSEAEKVKTTKPSPEQINFSEAILEIISPSVGQFGFVRSLTKIEKYFTTIVFRKGNQYIKISGSTYPTDYPHCYNIILGDGDSENFLEFDWNSIPLWRLKSKIEPTVRAEEYEFPFADKVRLIVANANNDLLKYANAFLHGDLILFNETRIEQNKDREPYKIHTANNDGGYVTNDEPLSVEQKKKYS